MTPAVFADVKQMKIADNLCFEIISANMAIKYSFVSGIRRL